MKRVGWVVAGIVAVLVAAVVWYATAGEAVMVQHLFVNGAGVPAGTVWVQSDQGLDGGPVTAIATLPGQGLPLYAGTNEDDIFVSVDDGHSWASVGAAPSGHYVVGIEIDPRAGGRTVGKAVYGAGFFLSEDAGRTWKNASRGLGSRALSCLAAPIGAPDTLFAGTSDAGLFVSHNGGHSWHRVGSRVLDSNIVAVAASADGDTVYVATQVPGLSVSHDGGATWSAVDLPLGTEPVVTAIAVDPADASRLMVSVAGRGVGVSTDGGGTWTASQGGALPSDCSAVQFLADGSGGLVAGTQSGSLFFSQGGAMWQKAFGMEGDGRVFSIVQAHGGVLAATSQGVLASADGRTWRTSTRGITNLTLRSLAGSPNNTNVLFAATDQGVFRSEDGGRSWAGCSKPVQILSVLALQKGQTILAGASDGSVLRSSDGGEHWISVSRGIPGVKVSSLVSPASEGAVVYAGTDNGCAVSVDAGLTWQARDNGLVPIMSAGSLTPRIEIGALLPLPGTPDGAILSLIGQGLFVTSDLGRHWLPLAMSTDAQWIVGLAADVRTGKLYAGTTAKGVLVSNNRGRTWSAPGSGFSSALSVPGSVNALAVAGDGTAYAGTQQRGVVVSRDGGATWQLLNAGLPALAVRALAVQETGVLAATAHHLMRLQTQ